MRKLKTNKALISVILVFGIVFNTFSQIQHRGCASHILDSIHRSENPSFNLARRSLEKKIQSSSKKQRLSTTDNSFIYTIPVVVHIVYDPNVPSSNISDEQVLEQLEALNKDFRRLNIDAINTPAKHLGVAADTKIQFCLANKDPLGNPIELAINRTPANKASYHYLNDDVKLKKEIYWPSDQYLNIWVTRLSSNILGYAQFPSDSDLSGLKGFSSEATTDGVVIDYRVFGVNPNSNSLYNLGRTLTHEVGHWLGLLHIFGENLNCDTDFVEDTPTQGVDNEGLTNCDTIIYSCGSNEVMYQNYMDYTSDRCMNLFTNGQALRMHSAILTSPNRLALLSSKGCCGEEAEVYTPPYSQNFDNEFNSISWNDSTYFTDQQWIQTITNYGFSAYSSNNSINQNSVATPHFNFKGLTIPTLQFDVSYAGESTNSDSLIIEYEATCSDNWVPVSLYSNTSLNTGNTSTPSNVSHWTTKQIPLPQLADKSLIRFRFTSIINNDNEVFVDNINLYNTTSELEGNIYPNPSNGIISASLSYYGKQAISIEVFNVLGQAVTFFEYESTYSPILNIPLSDLANGIYFLKINVNEEFFTEKIIITK